jgi:hypothetical protein
MVVIDSSCQSSASLHFAIGKPFLRSIRTPRGAIAISGDAKAVYGFPLSFARSKLELTQKKPFDTLTREGALRNAGNSQ